MLDVIFGLVCVSLLVQTMNGIALQTLTRVYGGAFFTSQTSPQVLKEIGTDQSLLCLTSLRTSHYFHETDEDINKKQKQSLLTVCFQSSDVVNLILKLTKLVKTAEQS